MNHFNSGPICEDWYWRFFNLDDAGKQEMLAHMRIEPVRIISFPLWKKLLYYPLFWIRQYNITCEYWNKPCVNRWFWRIYYTFDWCNLLIFSKVTR